MNKTKPSEKYQKLYEACKKNPIIILGNEGRPPRKYEEHKGYAKNGFVEKFCK